MKLNSKLIKMECELTEEYYYSTGSNFTNEKIGKSIFSVHSY